MNNASAELSAMGFQPIPKLILSFALPAIAGMIAGAVYNIVDRIFVGQYVGTTGLAAISVSFPPMIFMLAFAMLISVGGSSRLAILFGAGRRRAAEQALGITLTLLAGTSAVLAVLFWFAAPQVLKICGGSGETLAAAMPYLRIIGLGAPFGMCGFGLNAIIRASGSPRYAMCTQIIGAAANVALDALFIIVFDMGVAGAAVGTVAAQAISVVFGLSYFATRHAPLRIRACFLGRLRCDVIKRICAVGSAPFFMEISFVLYMTIFNQLVLKYGGELGLSAMGIFFSIDSLIYLPAMAIGEAAQPIIGYNYGAGEPKRVEHAIYWAIGIAVSFYITSASVAIFFAEGLIRMFTSNADLLAMGVPGMRIAYLGLPFMGVTIVTNSALQGLGKGMASLTLTFCRHILCMFTPLFIMPRLFGFNGLWMSFVISDSTGCIIAVGFLVWILKWLKDSKNLNALR